MALSNKQLADLQLKDTHRFVVIDSNDAMYVFSGTIQFMLMRICCLIR